VELIRNWKKESRSTRKRQKKYSV